MELNRLDTVGAIEKRCLFADFLDLEFISNTAFARHQLIYLSPVVHKSKEFEQHALLSSLQ